tara:strand:+ start:197 stop:718 length:522 start_codon:yes stop_codon:yes gene_type:complete
MADKSLKRKLSNLNNRIKNLNSSSKKTKNLITHAFSDQSVALLLKKYKQGACMQGIENNAIMNYILKFKKQDKLFKKVITASLFKHISNAPRGFNFYESEDQGDVADYLFDVILSWFELHCNSSEDNDKKRIEKFKILSKGNGEFPLQEIIMRFVLLVTNWYYGLNTNWIWDL